MIGLIRKLKKHAHQQEWTSAPFINKNYTNHGFWYLRIAINSIQCQDKSKEMEILIIKNNNEFLVH